MKRGFGKQGFSKHRTEMIIILIAGFAGAWINSAAATEVYTWTDSDGIVHYSDAPPDTRESQKIEVEDAYNPGTASAYPPSEEATDGSAGTDEPGPEESPKSAAQQRREQIAEDRKERREAQAEIDKMCKRHKQRVAQVEPARRVFYTDETGESVRLDDDQRLDMVRESKEYIAKNCE
jgi:hypothetical protein